VARLLKRIQKSGYKATGHVSILPLIYWEQQFWVARLLKRIQKSGYKAAGHVKLTINSLGAAVLGSQAPQEDPEIWLKSRRSYKELSIVFYLFMPIDLTLFLWI
jgi:hypothetical protein